MAVYAYRQVDFVAAHYPPNQLVSAGPGRRLVGAIIDWALGVLPVWLAIVALIMTLASATAGVTLFWISIVTWWAWFIWFLIAASHGQTPGKQLLRMYVLKGDATRAGGAYMLLREIVVKQWLFAMIGFLFGGLPYLISALWCLWDRDRQALWDKMCSTYVAWSPMGFVPATLNELLANGMPAPALMAGGFAPPPVQQPVINIINNNNNNALAGRGNVVGNVRTAVAVGSGQAAIGVLEGGHAQPQRTISAGERYIIGRGSDAHVRLHDPKASRHHLEVWVEGSSWVVRDMNATNPAVLLDDRGEHQLRNSVRIQAGQLRVGSALVTLYPPRER